MAYAKKYTIPFKQIKDYDGEDGWNIDIYAEGHGGGTTELYTERDSIVLQRDGGQFEWVNGTKLSFALYNLTEEQYIEFREATFGDYYCILSRANGGGSWFKGYNQSEIYTESYSDVPYSAKLEFTCGLSHLKYVRFDDSGTLYTGQKSLIEVIRLCLNKLPSTGMQIREFINEYEDSQNATTTDSMLNQTYVDTTVYREKKNGVNVGMTCHRVLTEILKCFNSHLFQSEYRWHIVRWQEYSDSTMYYRTFNANVGTESTITVDGTGSITTNKRVAGQPDGTSTELVITESTELSIEPPLNRIKLTYNQDLQDISSFELIKNGCMLDFTPNAYTGNPTEWNYTGIDPDTYNAIQSAGGFNEFEFDDIDHNDLVTSKYIKQTRSNIYINTTDRLRIRLGLGSQDITITKDVGGADYNALNTYLSAGWKRYYPVEIKIGSYYLDQTGAWTTTASKYIMTKTGCGTQMNFWEDVKDITVDDVDLLLTDTLPLSGFQDIEMTWFQPYSNIETEDTTNTDFSFLVTKFTLTCLSVIYEPDQTAAITDYTVYQEIDEDEEVLDIELIHGDGLYEFSVNSFRLSTGEVTNNWNRRGLTDNLNIFEMVLKQYEELRGSFVKMLSGEVITQMTPINTIEHTVNGTAYHYMIQDYTYKVETNEWDVNLMEIANFTSLTPSVNPNYRYYGKDESPRDDAPLTDNQLGSEIIEDSSKIYTTQNDINNYI